MTLSSIAASLSTSEEAPSQRRRALEAEFDRSGRSLYRYFAVRVGRDRHTADDLMQQLWLQAVRGGDAVPVGELEYWLRGIARNLIRAHWRQRSRRPTHVALADPALAAGLSDRLATEELPSALLERQEVRDQLLLAITELPTQDQELIVGHYFRGQSHAALARTIGVGTRAVEGRLYRARRALRDKLRNLES
jgi:RNA polymerase sigma-70 factor (ECF subfamily)